MNKKVVFLFVIVFLLIANFFVWQNIFSWYNGAVITFFDVGQGDSIFIESREGHQILIDGGPSGKIVLTKLAKVMPFWDRTIDLVVSTHPDSDHLRGLNYVLKRYRVKNILWTGVKKKTKTYSYWLDNIKKEKAKIFIARKGETIRAGDLKFFVLYPFENLKGKTIKDTNNTSIVLRMKYFSNTALLTGDISSSAEKKIIGSGENVESQILKIAHHGSRSSTSNEFLKMVKPILVIISVGKNNPYHHPSKEVLQRLNSFAIRVLRTDINSDIKVLMDGNNIALKLSKQ